LWTNNPVYAGAEKTTINDSYDILSRRRAAREKHKWEMIVAMRSILTDVGESLETAISYLNVSPTDPTCQISLPLLTELTIHDGFPVNWIINPIMPTTNQQLRRLHIGDV
jgi:hypothetical protein